MVDAPPNPDFPIPDNMKDYQNPLKDRTQIYN